MTTGPGTTRRAPSWPTASALVLMAACAGAVDLLAITSLGESYAGVVTGNLVSVGRAVGEGRAGALVAPLVAVAGFGIGVTVWAAVWRTRAVLVPLLAELVLLAGVAVVWPLAGSAPGRVTQLVLLGVTAVAMGGQSSTALRLGESTTYLTGTLTGALAGVVTGGGLGRLSALRQLVALAAGAAVAAFLLGHLRWSVPLLAVVLLAAATAVWLAGRGRTARTGDAG